MQKMLIISPQSCKKSDNLRAKKSTLKKFTYMYFCKVYFCKVYFPKVYPTCVSSMLCEFIEYEHVKSPKTFYTWPTAIRAALKVPYFPHFLAPFPSDQFFLDFTLFFSKTLSRDYLSRHSHFRLSTR